jgi:hypothetical protein
MVGISRATEVAAALVTAGNSEFPDAQQQFPIACKTLHGVIVLLVCAKYPNRPCRIDRNRFLLPRPLRPAIDVGQMSGPTPRLYEVAIGIEFDNGRKPRCRVFALIGRTPLNVGCDVQHPYVSIVRRHSQPRDGAKRTSGR